jgi:hypothetical protein
MAIFPILGVMAVSESTSESIFLVTMCVIITIIPLVLGVPEKPQGSSRQEV